MALQATEVASGSGDALAVAAGSHVYLAGFTVIAGAAAAVVYLRDGSGGNIVAKAKCPANDTRHVMLADGDDLGVRCPNGVYVDRDGTNACELTVYTHA